MTDKAPAESNRVKNIEKKYQKRSKGWQKLQSLKGLRILKRNTR